MTQIRQNRSGGIVRRTLVAATVVAVITAASIVIWKSIHILLLVFLATLVAILFQGVSGHIQRWTRAPYWVCVSLALGVAVGLLALATWLRAPAVAEQIQQLRSELPAALARLHELLAQHAWGRAILDSLPSLQSLATRGQVAVSNAATVFSTAFTVVAYGFFVLATFLFITYQPGLYRRGIEALVRPGHREHARRVLDEIWTTLWWWLAARIVAMCFVGVLVTSGVWLLGLPFALSLGLLAAALDFVPNIGPIVAALPAILLAAVQSPEKALYVALLYGGVQIAEGYVITPIAQKKAIDMPPALVIGSQFVLGAALGSLGFVLATPLVAAALVLINHLYVKPLEPAA